MKAAVVDQPAETRSGLGTIVRESQRFDLGPGTQRVGQIEVDARQQVGISGRQHTREHAGRCAGWRTGRCCPGRWGDFTQQVHQGIGRMLAGKEDAGFQIGRPVPQRTRLAAAGRQPGGQAFTAHCRRAAFLAHEQVLPHVQEQPPAHLVRGTAPAGLGTPAHTDAGGLFEALEGGEGSNPVGGNVIQARLPQLGRKRSSTGKLARRIDGI